MNETNHTKFKKRAAALAVASCLSLTPWVADAAGLGKLTVYSGLGQPLRAELDIGATRDETAGMTARLAPPDAFKQAGIDYSGALRDLRFSIEKRADGQSVVKVTSVRPLNEPFLDFLVELNWPSGRLVREYTFLLDPPEITARAASTQVNVAEAKVVETVRGGTGSGQATTRAARTPRPAPPPKLAAEPKKSESADTHLVKTGETLRKIAAENKYEGVSLEQMLVGLYQNNPDAFIGKNINRLKAGAILGIPDKAAVESVSQAEAKKVYVAQTGEWNAYRHKLASAAAKAPARDEAATQGAAGKITAKVEEKTAPAEQTKDQVKISKTEAATKGAAGGKASEVDAIAREKALKEAQERVAQLEKNVGDLQKLVDMKTQKLAELQQSTAKKEEAKPLEPAKPAVAPPPVEAPKVAAEPEKPVEPAKPVEPPKVVEEPKPVTPAPEVKPPEPPKPVEPPPPEKKPVAPPPPEVEEPGFIDSLLSDPLPLVGGGGILALLGGYFLLKRRRQENASVETTAAPSPSSLGPNSVFRMTGGQSVDTGNTPPQTGDFSQTGPGTIDTDEVDPVAEADVYMAYGRDTQAEEILLEAMQKDPLRTAIHVKLLEIYANRKSVKQFETLAGELYAQTGGAGPDWEKVAALGAGLDPQNPLYSAKRTAAPSAFDADATMVASPASLAMAAAATATSTDVLARLMDTSPTPIGESVDEVSDTVVLPKPVAATPVEVEPENDQVMSLDFDLGTPLADEPEKIEEVVPAAEPEVDLLAAAETNALDFDLGGSTVGFDEEVGELHVTDDIGLDFDLGTASVFEPREEPKESSPDFSPAGTMVMPIDHEAEAISTFVGADGSPLGFVVDTDKELEEELPAVAEEVPLEAVKTFVNPVTENDSTLTVVAPLSMNEDLAQDNPSLMKTSVNPDALSPDSLEFDLNLTDSVFLGQPMMPSDFDISAINLDLSAEPEPSSATETVVSPPASGMQALDEPSIHDAQWEEVNTKLDLAKAYEEMGDLEGARELLQEVLGEGPSELVEQAKTILARIGE